MGGEFCFCSFTGGVFAFSVCTRGQERGAWGRVTPDPWAAGGCEGLGERRSFGGLGGR